MRAVAEGDVLVLRPGQVQLVRAVELGRVAVGRAEVHDHLVALADRLAPQLGVEQIDYASEKNLSSSVRQLEELFVFEDSVITDTLMNRHLSLQKRPSRTPV